MARFMSFLVGMLAIGIASGAKNSIFYGTAGKGIISTQIPRANTPGCSYGKDPSVSDSDASFPPMFLTKCTQPLAPTAVDLRGWWKDPKKPDSDKGERIEQCGLRIIITAGGVIHDTYIADGTLNNGVKDVSYYDCSPINVAGRFDKSKNAFTFYDSDDKMLVTRTRLNATHMKFMHPLLGTVYYIKQTRKPGTEN